MERWLDVFDYGNHALSLVDGWVVRFTLWVVGLTVSVEENMTLCSGSLNLSVDLQVVAFDSCDETSSWSILSSSREVSTFAKIIIS